MLVPHIEGFERYPAAFQIPQLITPEGRPLYSIGTERFGGLVQIGFSPNRCSAVPDIAQVMRDELIPINVTSPQLLSSLGNRNRTKPAGDWDLS